MSKALIRRASDPLRELSDAGVWERFEEAVRELRIRNQIAVTWWSLEDMDRQFDILCKRFEPTDMEPHRANFRKFGVRRIGYFLGHDGPFNNRTRRDLLAWLKKHANTDATRPVEDDTRAFWEAVEGTTAPDPSET